MRTFNESERASIDRAAARRGHFKETLRSRKAKLFSSRSMMVLGCILIGQGIYALRVGLEGELDRLERDRKFATDTRERVFVLETLLEAEGIIKASDSGDEAPKESESTEPADDDEPDEQPDEGLEAPPGDDDEKADLSGDEWTRDEENPTDGVSSGTETLG